MYEIKSDGSSSAEARKQPQMHGYHSVNISPDKNTRQNAENL
jgi:hypothetical protein